MRISDWSSDVCSSDLRPSTGGHETLRAIVEGGYSSSAQISLAPDIISSRVAARDDGGLGLFEIRRAEALRPRTADAPPIEQVPCAGNLRLGDAAEVGIMLVPSRQLQFEAANQWYIHFGGDQRNSKLGVGRKDRARPLGVGGWAHPKKVAGLFEAGEDRKSPRL